MGSRRFRGVLFVAHPGDHDPPHIHAFVGEGEVIIELTLDSRVKLADRRDAVRRAKETEVRKVVNVAVQHYADLVQLWEKMNE